MKHMAAVQVLSTGSENCAHANNHVLADSVQFLLELWPSFCQEGLRKEPLIKLEIHGNGVDKNIDLKDKTNLFQILTQSIHQGSLYLSPWVWHYRGETMMINLRV